MDTERYQKIQYLARCSYQAGSWEKRFARDMSRLEPDDDITLRQAFAIDRQYYRYRKQIAAMPGDKPDFIQPGDVNELLSEDELNERHGKDILVYRTRDMDKEMRAELEALDKLAKWNKNARPE